MKENLSKKSTTFFSTTRRLSRTTRGLVSDSGGELNLNCDLRSRAPRPHACGGGRAVKAGELAPLFSHTRRRIGRLMPC